MKVSTYAQLGQYRRKFLQYNRLLYASALLGFASPAAYAVNTEFTGNIDNDWSNAANWSNGVPSSADLAIIDSSITSATDVTLSAKLSVGFSSAGMLSINDSIFTTGTKDVDLGALAESSGGAGTINITGASSSFINSAIVQIGKAKAGTGYMVLDGGTISGVKYRLGAGGTGSFGSLHIKSGTVNVSSEFRLGSGWASEGQLTIDDGSFTVKDLIFAYNGESEGTLVHNGGITKVTKLTLGRNNTSNAAIELNGGVLQVDTLDKIGNSSNESISIAGGILRLKQGSNLNLLKTLHAKNSLNWTPTAAVVGYDPASADETIVNANGTLYIRNDADGYFSVWSTIVVINNPPVFTNDPINTTFIEKDQPYNGTLAGTATDADDDLLTYAIVSGPAWLSVAADGSLIGEPSAADVGTNSFTIEVSDGNFGNATTLLNIWVAGDFTELTFDDFQAGWGNWLDGGEDAEIARTYAIERRAAREDNRRTIHPHTTSFKEQGVGLQDNSGVESSTTLANTLDLTDYDQVKIDFTYLSILFSDEDSFTIRYSSDGGENWQTIKTFTHGIDFNNGTREVVSTIFNRSEINFTDNTLIRFQADANGNSADVYIDSVGISARATSRHNSAPIFTNDPINTVNATKTWPYEDTIAGSATDVDAEPLTYSKTSGPAWLTIAADGTLTGTPQAVDVGANIFTVQASDGLGGITQATLNITVDFSLAPSFTTNPFNKESAKEDTDYSASIAGNASDPEGAALSFAKLSGPEWLNVTADGALSGTPTAADVGFNSFSIKVSDGTGGINSATLTIYVASIGGAYPDYGKAPTADEWLPAFGLTGADAAANANPDGDAMDNFHEYAYGGDPTSSDDTQVVQEIKIIDDVFTVRHTRLRNATSLGIDYQFQLAENASDPQWLDITPDDINVELISASYELVSFSGNLPFDLNTDISSSIGRLVVTRSGPFADQGAVRTHAELVIADHTKTQSGDIYEAVFGHAAPQGMVDNSSPWMQVNIPLPDNNVWHGDRLNRLYQYKLSMDPTFATGVITEAPKRWSFFNASRKLAPGTWYWTAGYALKSEPENVQWLPDVYEFEISGDEEQYLPPSAEEVWAIAQAKASPKILMRPSDLGTLLDIADNSTEAVIAHAESILTNSVADANTVAKLVLAYGASGDSRYLEAALIRYPNITDVHSHEGGGFGSRDYLGMGIAFLDIVGDDLDPEMKSDLIANMIHVASNWKENWIRNMLGKYEHEHYDSHIVQLVIHMLLWTGLSIGDDDPGAKEMFQYGYELWLYKGPHGGRSDGSWHNGFGYLGFNEDQLMSTPWMLSELTGFDYMMHPWYRNHAKFMSYTSASGNPGQYYGDKGWDAYGTFAGGGPTQYLAYLQAFTHPNNRWLRWQAQHNPAVPLTESSVGNMAKNWQRWSSLAIRKNYVEPDFVNVQTPVATAAAFRDVGYVAAHSNIEDASTNFMTTMRTSPFSSTHKSHASQNAFTTAYGGEPLFYRTGWRKTGSAPYSTSGAFNLITPNGVSQERTKRAYGFLPRFAHGDRMSYWTGDASTAYPVSTGVKRFRRHMVHLKPNILVIYDELESTESDTAWTYTLNAHFDINKLSNNVVSVHNGKGLATANLFTSSAVTTTVTQETATNKPTHWNTAIVTDEKMPAVRFLNVIELTPSTNINEAVSALAATGTDLITVAAGDYTVVAQVDPNQPARLEIRSSDGNVALLYAEGVNNLVVNSKTVLPGRYKSSTLFMEKNTPRGDIVEELVDVLPDAVTYANKY